MILPIIFEDNDYIAINKPSGLLVHRTKIATEKMHFALQILRDQVGYRVYPLHRLDRPTSGVLIFAKNLEAAKLLGPYFENHQIQKEYLAIVRGYTNQQDIIDYPIKNEGRPPQEAITEYLTLATVEIPVAVGRYETARYSLVKAFPKTGRMHQIRRHFGHIRHYIIGDKTHGDWRHNRMFEERFNCPNLFLHANSLAFTHPIENKPIHIKAPLPSHFTKILQEFNWINFLT